MMPADRRAVLEELLDIGVYERIMRRRTGRKSRELDAEARAIDQVLQSTYADATEDALTQRRKEREALTAQLGAERENRDALQRGGGARGGVARSPRQRAAAPHDVGGEAAGAGGGGKARARRRNAARNGYERGLRSGR